MTGYLTTTSADGGYTLCLPAGVHVVIAGARPAPGGTYSQSDALVTIVAGVGETRDFVLGGPCVPVPQVSPCSCRTEPGTITPCPPPG